jgi:hypothetical protein
MTIATGFDIGQRSGSQLSKMALPPEVKQKLEAYAGVKFTGMSRAHVLRAISDYGPIPVLTKQEADLVDGVVHGEHLRSARDSFNARRKPGIPHFQNLPANWETVLFSRTFHQGVGMPDTAVARPFYTAVIEGRWQDAITALRNYHVSAGWYRERVTQEAALLATQLPAPVQLPIAPPPDATPSPVSNRLP